MKMALFWVVVLCSLVEVYHNFRGVCFLSHRVIMDAASTIETFVNFYQTTWHNNPEDSHLQNIFYLQESYSCSITHAYSAYT
jgi:hypothetical protein